MVIPDRTGIKKCLFLFDDIHPPYLKTEPENRLPAMNLYLYFLLNMDCPVDFYGKKEIC